MSFASRFGRVGRREYHSRYLLIGRRTAVKSIKGVRGEEEIEGVRVGTVTEAQDRRFVVIAADEARGFRIEDIKAGLFLETSSVAGVHERTIDILAVYNCQHLGGFISGGEKNLRMNVTARASE